jgi:hypothetical protein
MRPIPRALASPIWRSISCDVDAASPRQAASVISV